MPAAIAVPAIIGAAGIGTQLVGAKMASGAARDAAETQERAAQRAAAMQAQATRDALAAQERAYGHSAGLLAPYAQMGASAMGSLAQGLGLPAVPAGALPMSSLAEPRPVGMGTTPAAAVPRVPRQPTIGADMTGTAIPMNRIERVQMVSPDGEVGFVAPDRVSLYLARGARVVR